MTKVTSASTIHENLQVQIEFGQTSGCERQVRRRGMVSCCYPFPREPQKRGMKRIGTNLPGHTSAQPDLPGGFLPVSVCLGVILVDHIKHDSRGEFVVRLTTTLECLKDVDGVPGTNTLRRRGRGQYCIEGWKLGEIPLHKTGEIYLS